MAETNREGLAKDGAKAVYDRLVNSRQPYEKRAEDSAKYTIPSLYPKASDGASTDYTTPWQSVGARGVNNLASKLMLAMFPIGSPFFKLNLSEFEAKTLVDNPDELQKVDDGLAMVERIVTGYMESNSYRVTAFELMKQLVVSGNGLLYVTSPEDTESSYSPMKLYRLGSYVVERDAYGNVLQLVTRDTIAYAALAEDIRSGLDETDDPTTEFEVYTHAYLDHETGEFLSYQEIEGVEVDGSEGQYPRETLPWLPVRLIKTDGEDYGRSFCEEYIGDLKSLENLYEAMIKMSMIAAKVVFLVNPNGITQPRRLNKAATGDFVAGRKQDVEALQLEKQADFNTARSVADSIEGRISYAFMLNSAVQRSGERVTAEEIRYVAGELEDTLGGVYSVLSQELQLPLVKILLNMLQATSQIPDLPKEALEPAVATGLEALGRGHDLDKLMQFLQVIQPLAGIQDPDLNLRNIKMRIANSLGIDTAGLLLTEEDKAKAMTESAMATGMDSGAAAAGSQMADPATAQAAAEAAGM